MTNVTATTLTFMEIGSGSKAPTVGAKVSATAPFHSVSVSYLENPKKFKGNNFKRCQDKMLFYLTTLSLVKFLKENTPVQSKDVEDEDYVVAVQAWFHVDYLCKHYILSSLNDTLFNVYSFKESAKSLWESLEKKYKVNDANASKSAVVDFHVCVATFRDDELTNVVPLESIA